ncbi:hypothetical protein Q6346_07875 [Isoptericola sp. b490]|nr:hypothetical protein [Isoptericola sp. b490]
MGKGRRLRAERVVERPAAARSAAESVAWSDIEALLPPGSGPSPAPRALPRAEARARRTPRAQSAVAAPTRRGSRGRDCAELTRLAGERDEPRGRLAEAEAAIVTEVRRERRAGASWGDVGRALRMTRQGARQRFGLE